MISSQYGWGEKDISSNAQTPKSSIHQLNLAHQTDSTASPLDHQHVLTSFHILHKNKMAPQTSVIVIGAAGNIGSRITHHLLASGGNQFKVSALTRASSRSVFPEGVTS